MIDEQKELLSLEAPKVQAQLKEEPEVSDEDGSVAGSEDWQDDEECEDTAQDIKRRLNQQLKELKYLPLIDVGRTRQRC
jgi:hypothetical protein